MTDYVAIALQGFSTGIGVIIAHEAWDVFKRYRARVKHEFDTKVVRRLFEE
jgi:hypothetical protein